MPELSEEVLVTIIGGVFTIITAIITVSLKNRASRPADGPGLDVAPEHGGPAARLANALFLGLLFIIGLAVSGYVGAHGDASMVRNVSFGVALVLAVIFLWGDAVHGLVVRQLAAYLKAAGIFAGVKIGLVLGSRVECAAGTRACGEGGLVCYIEAMTSGWLLLAVMVLAAAVVVEIMAAVR